MGEVAANADQARAASGQETGLGRPHCSLDAFSHLATAVVTVKSTSQEPRTAIAATKLSAELAECYVATRAARTSQCAACATPIDGARALSAVAAGQYEGCIQYGVQPEVPPQPEP